MNQIVINSSLVPALTPFAPIGRFITSPEGQGEYYSVEWRGTDFFDHLLTGLIGLGDLPLGLFLYFVGGYPSGRKAEKLLENIQGPKPKVIEKKFSVILLPKEARPGVEEFHPVPLANVEKVLVGASAPGELAGGLWVELKGSFACFPLPEGVVVKILKAKGSRGMQWGHEAPRVQQTWWTEGSGYSLPLWRAERRRMGMTLAEERGLPSAPKEVRLLLAAAPAACGTEPRKLVAWAQQEKARLTAEKKSKATKKGASLTGLSAGPEPLTKGELYRATRWLKRQIRACRLEKKMKERAAKMAARERQALIEAAERLLWSQVDSPSGFGTDKTRASGQTSVGRVWTGRRPAERVHA